MSLIHKKRTVPGTVRNEEGSRGTRVFPENLFIHPRHF